MNKYIHIYILWYYVNIYNISSNIYIHIYVYHICVCVCMFGYPYIYYLFFTVHSQKWYPNSMWLAPKRWIGRRLFQRGHSWATGLDMSTAYPPQEVQLNGCQFCRILVLQICGCLSSWIGGRRIRSHRFTIYGHQTSCFPSHQILGTHLIPEYFRQNPEITHRKCWLSNFAQTNDKTQKVRLSGITYSQHIKHDKNPWSHGSWIEFWSILIHTICSCKKNTGLFSQQRLNMELLWAGLTRT